MDDLSRSRAATSGDEARKRLVARRDRMAALLRGSRPVEAPAEMAAYRSSYASRLWALGQAAELAEPERVDDTGS